MVNLESILSGINAKNERCWEQLYTSLLCGDVRVRGVDREGYGLLQGHRAGLAGESLALGYSVRFRPGIDGVLV